MAALPSDPVDALRRFVGVLGRPRTYLNQVYLWAQFPLGIAYFVCIVVLTSLSAGLAVLLVGVPLFLVTTLTWLEVAACHRYVVGRLAEVDIEARPPDLPERGGLGRWLIDLYTDLRTWASAGYLLSLFPIGIGLFAALVTGVVTSVVFIATPLFYDRVPTGIILSESISLEPSVIFEVETWRVGVSIPFRISSWYVDTLPEALVFSLFGVVMLLAVLHLSNYATRLLGQYTRLLLGGGRASLIRHLTRAEPASDGPRPDGPRSDGP